MLGRYLTGGQRLLKGKIYTAYTEDGGAAGTWSTLASPLNRAGEEGTGDIPRPAASWAA
jgi:hypothetical protein